LPERDRATMAEFLIGRLDPVSEPEVEAAWSEEIRRRVTEVDGGTVELIPSDEAGRDYSPSLTESSEWRH